MRNSTVLALAATAMLSGWSMAQSPTAGSLVPRVEIALFKYHGLEKRFDVFRGLIKQKVLNLQNEVIQDWSSSSVKLNYVRNIHVKYRGEDTFEQPRDVVNWMHNEAAVLNVMRGTILSDDGTNYVVFSQFYMHDDTKYLPSNVITVQLPVKIAEFANTRDTHTIVILYALAMDAERRGLDPAHIAPFLSIAKNLITDIERRSGPLRDDLADLKAAVETAEAKILGDGNAASSPQ